MKHLVLIAAVLLAALGPADRIGSASPLPANAPTFRYFLPIVLSTPLTPPYDMARFMVGDGRLYEVQHSGGSQARHQTQVTPTRFYHTKGSEWSAEWEELWATADMIYRGTDTSPGDGRYYTLYDGDSPGSAWSPRFWDVGDLYERNPFVVFRRKSDCQIVLSGYQRSWLRFEAFYPSYTFRGGIKLDNVVELTWLLSPDGAPVESYFYAEHFGLVGWGSADRGYSYVSQVHAPGARPDNKREVIPCLDAGGRLRPDPALSRAPLPPEFRVK